MAFPEHPIGQFEGTEISKSTWPRRTQIREFKGNLTHSNTDGLMFDRGPSATGTFNAGGNPHMAFTDKVARTGQQESFIEDFTSYKNRNGGIWARGEMHVFRNLKLADNAIGYTHAYPGIQPGGGAFTSKVVDSLFVGETENAGNPTTDAEKAYGRSLPYPELPDFPIRGFEYYDFLHAVENTTFRNYEDNATRKTGAISYLLFTSFPTNPENSVEKVKFIKAKPAYFPTVTRKWGNDNGGSAGWMTAGFKDKDGSITGKADSYIVNNNGLVGALDACKVQPTWNAAVCRGDVGRMNVGTPRAPGAGPGGPGAGGPRPAGAGPGAAAGPGGPPPAARAAGPGPGAGPGGPGAGPGPGLGGGAPGARPGAAPAGPPQPPVVLSSNGKEFTATGDAVVVSGSEIKVATERPTVAVTISHMDAGSWVIFQLPGFTTAASGTEQSSLAALRKADATSYYKAKDALWVKVVSVGGPSAVGSRGGGGSVQVSR
jgi:cell migration-inducing and hyaluronan-binding protein